jgi:hypothetical protein
LGKSLAARDKALFVHTKNHLSVLLFPRSEMPPNLEIAWQYFDHKPLIFRLATAYARTYFDILVSPRPPLGRQCGAFPCPKRATPSAPALHF